MSTPKAERSDQSGTEETKGAKVVPAKGTGELTEEELQGVSGGTSLATQLQDVQKQQEQIYARVVKGAKG